MQIHAFLTFPGTCEEAFTFYQTALKGEIKTMMKHEDAPAEAAPPVAVDWRGKIIYAELAVNDTILMGSDAQPENYHAPAGLDISLAIKNPERADRVFKALSEGGTVRMPLQKTFWAAKFGMVTDKFGIPWMINCA